MKYYEVLPLAKTGAGDSVFTYEYEEVIPSGSLVSVPLRNRFVRGMVIGTVKKPDFVTKQIKKIQTTEPVLSEIQIKLAQNIADFYFCNLSDVIPTILSFEFGKKRRAIPEEKNYPKVETPPEMTADQNEIYKKVLSGKPGSKYLLFGVTGSGKTEIYLRLAENALKKDQGSIILVPEISLTPQTLARFEKRFGDKVAVWHSGLKETEKYDTWQKIKSGQKQVVLGARSAIFTPVKNLGYIFIDEEHESSYKQDQTPRYETGRVAEWFSDLTRAKLVSGSATPKIETFHKTKTGDYNLLTLNKRIVQEEMPPVKIIDLREEFRKGNKSIFSDRLYEEITACLKEKKQVMLFVNRRGASTFVVCRDCGQVEECPNCDIPLTFHFTEEKIGNLRCHHCGFGKPIPTVCPNCKSYAIRYFGLGTQKVEIEAQKLFPKAKIKRMDSDTTRKRGSHEILYSGFAAGDYDILIGTQLIAKGWDLPNVALVGVISADTMLNLPDFRSSERTFDLLTQIAGRVGRGFHPGKVIIQTYSPENYAITFAAGHDFEGFYAREVNDRKKYLYPPFSRLIKLTYSTTDEKKTEAEAERLAQDISNELKNDCEILGASTAFLTRIAKKYRWQIILKIKEDEKTEETQKKVFRVLKEKLKTGWTVDVNPESLL